MVIPNKSRRWNFVAFSLLLVTLLAWPMAAAARGVSPLTGGSCTYSGRATVVQATVLGVTTVINDTGPLPSSGGAAEVNNPQVSVPGLFSGNALHAEAFGADCRSSSEASVSNLDLTVPGHHLNAGVLTSRSTATCGATGPSTTGNSEIEGLVLDNTAIFVTGQPNQTVAFPGGMLIINEQTSAGSGDLTVNAVHLVVFGVADVIISLAHADITCG